MGSGDKIALRGFARKQDYISQSDTRSLWNYNACPEVWTVPASCYNNSNVAEMLPASGSDAWEGFVPKIFDPSNWGNNDNSTRNNFKTTYVYAVIQSARTYAGGADTFVPKYWILFNEPDAAGFFAQNNFPQLEPEHPGYLHGSVNLVWAIRQGYIDKGITPPKIIIETGSQIHAPGTSATNHWSGDGCNPGAFPPDKDPNDYWGCTHDDSVWISDFWNALKADMNANSTSYPMSLAEVKAAIGGFGGHYYPPADANCGLPSCYLNTTRPVEFVSALKTWMSSEFSDREVWMIETATHLTSSTGCTNVTYGQLGILEQRDTFPCDQSDESTKYYNVRNYVGKLQEAFAEAGVNRWAWFADRYGGRNPCSDGSGGEMTALNASCTSYFESPFGNNYSLAASYR